VAKSESDRVSIGVVADRLGLSQSRVRQLAEKGLLPATTTEGGHRRFDLAEVDAAWREYRGAPQPSPPEAAPRWRRGFELRGLAEDQVWAEVKAAAAELADHPRAQQIAAYAVTEMVNNAVDHSDGERVGVSLWVDPAGIRLAISDDGVGVFERLRSGLDLEDEFAAIAELTKGKRTTDPAAHTGEGIFFTSKAVDLFVLESNGFRWTVDNRRADEAVGTSAVTDGTAVRMSLDLETDRDLTRLFREFTVDHDFVRTRPVIKLFEVGTEFVSRSEAKRLLAGLEQFREVELDFRGVESVGQGFVDEVFRVWPRNHSDTELVPTHMNDAVRFMVERGLPRR
jgi:excisionase family DNA binding protein